MDEHSHANSIVVIPGNKNKTSLGLTVDIFAECMSSISLFGNFLGIKMKFARNPAYFIVLRTATKELQKVGLPPAP